MDLHDKIIFKLNSLYDILQKYKLTNKIECVLEHVKQCKNTYILNILPCQISGNYDISIMIQYLLEIDYMLSTIDSEIKYIQELKPCNAELSLRAYSLLKNINFINDRTALDGVNLPRSEIVCETCGSKECIDCGENYNVVALPEETKKGATQNSHDPLKHYKIWINKIHGFEKKEIPEEVVERIKHCIKRDRLVKRDITIKVLRKYLKDLNLTDYNSDIVLLSIRVGGPQPPRLCAEDKETHCNYFKHIMAILDKIENGESNRPYYPSFIYKIYDHMFKNEPEKREILKFIHIQSKKTTCKFNKLFERICNYNNGELGITYELLKS